MHKHILFDRPTNDQPIEVTEGEKAELAAIGAAATAAGSQPAPSGK